MPVPHAPPGGRHRPGSTGEVAFNTWLQGKLHDMYDGVASEPVPEELRRLIERDREK